ncbi:uncharacterized protein LTR77_008708 [Saxophila tyrrhenica]|uniref:Uncharacterized protein n=1 Tax=Saxophila tyrrhenica TaxID=1690608 RepID=A0AAV9P020_9PEZI|nr:hypothetical protein LTR77_008708 [Saxophila tyrrhenica]
MSTSKVLLVLGAGGNVGASVASSFAKNGYKVAIAARRLSDAVDDDGNLQIQADLSKPETVKSSFDKVTAKFGPPSVVVYNAASAQPVPAESPLDLPLEAFNRDIAVNTASVLVAAQNAVEGFKKLPKGTAGTFIFTGNFLNVKTMPFLVSGGIGKAATAHLLQVASQAYAPQGFRFYFADERKADGSAAFRDISGPNHAEHYLSLAKSTENQPWWQTFVGGQGYKHFPEKL